MSKEQLDMKNALERFLKAKPENRDAAFRQYIDAATAAVQTTTPLH
jgi:hypothetical protein